MNAEVKEKICQEIGCYLPGHKEKALPGGEIEIRQRARHGGEWHIAKFNLAEKTVQRIKSDSKFAEYFRKLLES